MQGAKPQEYLMYSKVAQRSRRCLLVELDSAVGFSDAPLGKVYAENRKISRFRKIALYSITLV